jgi:hypothetical protein
MNCFAGEWTQGKICTQGHRSCITACDSSGELDACGTKQPRRTSQNKPFGKCFMCDGQNKGSFSIYIYIYMSTTSIFVEHTSTHTCRFSLQFLFETFLLPFVVVVVVVVRF